MFLTEKKVVRINENTLKRKLKADKCHDDENMDYQKVLQSLESGCVYLNTSSDESQTEVISRKRMRLHQLSWEEKIQRKKMRNRIAAQTSRDRKKAKMDLLEDSVKELQQQNNQLFSQVSELKKQNESLIDANKELQKLLSTRSLTCMCQKQSEKSNEVTEASEISFSQIQTCVGDDLPFDRPAESTLPQQKGQRPTSAQSLTATSWSLWKILTVYLLSLRCWQMAKGKSSLMTWNDWQQVCFKKLNSMTTEELQKIWKMRTQEVANSNATFLMKWWGRHQKSWRPVEMVEVIS